MPVACQSRDRVVRRQPVTANAVTERVIPSQSSDWRGNLPVEWDRGTMATYALLAKR